MKNNNPEYTVVNLLFYSFIICMLIFMVFRFLGILWFSQSYVPFEVNPIGYNIISILLKTFEGAIILKILTKLKTHYCTILAIMYSLLIFILNQPNLEFILDIVFIVSLPYIFNDNKEQSIINSSLYIVLISAYQLLMSFSRYSMSLAGKYDLGYALLSVIDYRVFLIVVLLFVHKHRINKGGKS